MDDSTEVQATAQRKSLRPYRSVSQVRTRPRADSTADVAIEDILLEAYIEPPPPTKRSPQSQELAQPKPQPKYEPDEPLRVSFPSVPPPRPSEQARVDALLSRHVEVPPSYEVEVPSIAPVAFATPGYAPVFPTAPPIVARPPQPPSSKGGAIAAALALVLASGATGSAVALATHPAWIANAKSAVTPEKREAPIAAAPPQLPPPSTVVTAPPPPPAPTPTPTPTPPSAPTIDPSTTLVTFPPYAAGHRIFFDGKLVPYDGSPVALKCGRHVLRIGLNGRVRNVSFACGEATTLK